MATRGVERLAAPLAVLAACGLGLVGIAGAALLRFPLLATYKVQVLTLDAQVRYAGGLAPALVLAALLAFACYAAGFLALRQATANTSARGPLLALVLAPPLVCATLLLFVHPTTSLDLYDYLYRGHMAARYGANNFVDTPEELRRLDRLYWYTAWRRATTAYGPLWELLSVGVAQLAGRGLLGLALGFKLASLIGWLLVALALLAASQVGERLVGLFVWLWNPLVLWELVGAAHNDGWMLACIVLALACLRRWPTLALLLVTAGALFKYPAALLWPVLLAAAVAGTPGTGARLRLLARAGFLSVLLIVLAYAPWWAGDAMLEQVRGRRALFTSSPLALIQAMLRERIPKEELLALMSRLSAALLAGGLLVATWLASWRPRLVVPICAGLLLWFLTAATPWFQPWYLAWLLGLLALQPRALAAHWALGAMSLGALLSYPAFAALRPWLDWPAKEPPWQSVLVALIYGPLLLGLVRAWRPRLRPGRREPFYPQQEAT
jgi:hypothetical protein